MSEFLYLVKLMENIHYNMIIQEHQCVQCKSWHYELLTEKKNDY